MSIENLNNIFEGWRSWQVKEENEKEDPPVTELYPLDKFDPMVISNAQLAADDLDLVAGHLIRYLGGRWAKFGKPGGMWNTESGDEYITLYSTAAIFQNIEPLRIHKITKVLGKGTKGIVYLLDNGNALKIFMSGHLPSHEKENLEFQFYKTSKDKLFLKKGTLNTLPVYDFGEIKDFLKLIDPRKATSKGFNVKQRLRRNPIGKSIYWAEMAVVKTLEDYIHESGRSPGDWSNVLYSLEKVIVNKTKNPDNNTYLSDLRALHRIAKDGDLSMNEVAGLARMVLFVIKEYGPEYLKDMHIGNIGILENSVPRHGAAHDNIRLTDPTAKPVFILFDP
jgi:hypothetical protein